MGKATRELRPPTGCTVVTRSCLPAAKALARSYLDHHPEHEFVIAVIDGAEDQDTGLRYRVVGPDWIDVSDTEYLRMATCYSADELARAVKPLLLRRLLTQSDVVVYLQPDIRVVAPFPEVAHLADNHDIVLTPRLLEPLPRDGKQPDDAALMGTGTFDLGFIAVGQGAKPFLDSWSERARRDAIADPDTQLFPDQRWLDQVPALFRHKVLRDPGFNVGYWNAHERALVQHPDGTVTTRAEPLRFFTFSGYRPATPWLLSSYCADRPRVLLSEHPVLRQLCDSYRENLLSAGYRDHVESPLYRFGSLPDGSPLTSPMRRLYRAAWIAAEQPSDERTSRLEGPAIPPHPFGDDQGTGFRRWVSSPGSPLEHAAGLNRLATWVWASRTDLQGAFPSPCGESSAAFRNWCRTHGIAEELLPEWAAPREPDVPEPPVDEFGVNLAGYLTAELGLGEMGRIVHQVLEQAAVPVVPVVEEHSLACRTALPMPETTGPPRFPVSIVSVNADYTKLVLDSYPDIGHLRYRIGLWAWELEDFPTWLHDAFALVDEVWTVSEFCRTAIARHSPVPVKVIPVPVLDPGGPLPTGRRPGVPIRFLFAFDYNSTAQRKNPYGLVAAFQRAFPGRDDVRLVIKAINGQLHTSAAERLRHAVSNDHRIQLLERYFTVAELHELYASSDAYVSLHRSEGFGLTVAEAMVRAMPVIATDYSSTTEFLDDNVGWPIPYRLVGVGPGAKPYHAEAVWADPDLDAAAAAMREVADDPAEAARRGRAARDHILRTRSASAAGDWMRAELESAYRAWQQRGAAGHPVSSVTHRLSEPLDRARQALHRKADTTTPSRIPFAPTLRKAVLRSIDHYDVHQREVMGALADGVGGALDLVAQQLESHARRVDSVEFEVSRTMARLGAQLDRIERIVGALDQTVERERRST